MALFLALARSFDDVENPMTAFEYQGQAVAMLAQGQSAFGLVDSSGNPTQRATEATRPLGNLNRHSIDWRLANSKRSGCSTATDGSLIRRI